MPVSLPLMLAIPFPSGPTVSATLPPGCVNFSALVRRFEITSRIRALSHMT